MSYHPTRTAAAGTLVAALVTASLLNAGPATAGGGDDEVIREGSCSAGTDWKLKAKTDNGRLEVEGEIDSNRTGQTWTWKLLQNGAVVARGQGVTSGRSGSFEVRRVIPNPRGTDVVALRARTTSTGEVCRGSLSY